MTNKAKGVIFGCVLLVTTLLLGEIALRAVQYVVSGISPTTLMPLYKERRFVQSPFLVFGPRVDWQIPGKEKFETAYFNAQGFRTHERIGPKPRGQVRVIAIGGSTTEEVWNEEGLHWPLWLERELQKRGVADVHVYNAGMSAYSSAHDIVRLSLDVLDYEPDVVIVMHNINDLTVNYYAAVDGVTVDSHYRAAFARKGYTGDLTENDIVLSRLWHSLKARVVAATQTDTVVPDNYSIDNGLKYFRRNLGTIHALVADRGAQLVLLTMPVCDSESIYRTVEFQGRRQFNAPLPTDFARFNRDFDAYNEVVRQVAGARSAALVDMARLFGRDQRFYSDFIHYNAAGSRRFGEILAEQLAPAIRKISGASSSNGQTLTH